MPRAKAAGRHHTSMSAILPQSQACTLAHHCLLVTESSKLKAQQKRTASSSSHMTSQDPAGPACVSNAWMLLLHVGRASSAISQPSMRVRLVNFVQIRHAACSSMQRRK